MIGIILLAAGESKRLGQPKQLLPWRGSTLLRNAANVAMETGLGPVTVVLGASADACASALDGLSVRTIWNPNWKDGMGGSIAKGVESLWEEDLEAVLVMLCDQPFVDTSALHDLVTEWKIGGHEIVASSHDEASGPPALFSSTLFDELLALRGPTGAKSIIRNSSSLAFITCRHAAVDIDTPDDWEEIRGTYG